MDTKNFMLLRGARVENQIACECDHHELHERTYADLERNVMNFVPQSKKRQHAMGPLQVEGVEFQPIPHAGNLLVEAVVKNYQSETKSQFQASSIKTYNPKILFNEVEFHQPENEEEVANPNTLTIEGKNGKEFTISPIILMKNNVKVHCNCLDFFWRFSFYNHRDQSLLGYDVATYQKRTNRPPVNPRQTPAMCKHLLKLAVELKNNGIVR
jgi:hypothetical protein